MQEGFGWTNGVLLDLFSKYGDRIASDDDIPTNRATFFRPSQALVPLSLLVGLVVARR